MLRRRAAANARRSTGPKTEAGKKRASLNARTHGLTAADAVIPGESGEDFEAFRAALWAQWEPTGADQEFEAELAINDGWRILRAQRLEAGLFAYLIGTATKEKAWTDARTQGIEAVAEEEGEVRQPTRERREVFDRIETARRLLRDPKAILGAVYEQDAGAAGAFDKLSRHEGTLRSDATRPCSGLNACSKGTMTHRPRPDTRDDFATKRTQSGPDLRPPTFRIRQAVAMRPWEFLELSYSPKSLKSRDITTKNGRDNEETVSR